jgi:hypothetical protein
VALKTDDLIFLAMDSPDYYGGPRLYQTDYSRPFIPQPPARQVTAEQRAEMGRRIEAWKADVRARLPEMEEEQRLLRMKFADCVRPPNSEELAAKVAAILEALDNG